MSATPRLVLYAVPGSPTHDLASLDPESLVAASYLQLLHPGDWALVPTTDPGTAPALPVLHAGLDTFTGSAILHHLVQTANTPPALDPVRDADAKAFHALLDSTLLPLVLHSLYSLPQNWLFTRALIVPSLPFPAAFHRPAALRASARAIVDATHPGWWGLGGEAEKEQEEERRRKKALLETGIEGIKERNDLSRRDGKDRVKKTFGEGKIIAAARELFTALESTLANSSTPYFFSSSSPTPLDAHLSSLLSLVLFLPLPTPILADLLNASFPRLWAHAALLRRTLWSGESGSGSAPAPRTLSPTTAAGAGAGWWSALRTLLPRNPLAPRVTPTRSAAPETKEQRTLARNRRAFVAVCVLGLVGWAAGTGQLPLPLPVPVGGKWGRVLRRAIAGGGGGLIRFRAGAGEEGEEEWEEVDEEDDEEGEDEDEEE